MDKILPLKERDQKIINNWYIACLSGELNEKPIERIIYDTSLVLFRSQGKAVALLNRCLHRAALLHEGEVINGELKCPYHGWHYNHQGDVTCVPSEGANSKPQKMCQKNFRAEERDGVIWVWMGEVDPTTPPPWHFPFFEDSGWTKYFMITDFDNEVTHLSENFMDVPHTVFVHKGWFRNKTQKEVPMTVETKNGRVLVTYNQEDDKIGGAFHFLLNPKNQPMLHTDEYIYPNITRVDYTFGDYGFIINSQNTPVSTLKCRTYTYICYRTAFLDSLLKPFMQFYTRQVIEQDVDIMKNQGKSFSYDSRENFRSTDADELHIAIERLRKWGREGNDLVFTFADKKEKTFWI
jgi:phenylpropionate dioxygenase-like ring-hydroxylating dioxygenase large terminal subunit